MLIEHLFVDACVCVCVCAHVCAAWIGERWKERKSLNVLLSSNNCANTSNTISLTRQNYSTKIRRRRWMCASRYLFLIRTHTIFMFQPFAADEQAEDLPNFPFRVLYAKASITISDITCISRTSCWSVKRRKTHKNTKQQFNERKKTQLPCYHFTIIFFLANIYKELRSSIEEEYVHYVHMSRCGFHIFRLHWSDIEDEIIRQYIAKRCSPWKWPTLTRYKAEKKKQRRHIAQLFKFLFPTVLYIFRSIRFFSLKAFTTRVQLYQTVRANGMHFIRLHNAHDKCDRCASDIDLIRMHCCIRIDDTNSIHWILASSKQQSISTS